MVFGERYHAQSAKFSVMKYGKYLVGLAVIGFVLTLIYTWEISQPEQPYEFQFEGPAILIHGGAGTITRENMTPEMEAAVTASLSNAVDTGYAMLLRGDDRLVVVARVLSMLEDDTLFNAGLGAVLTYDGLVELDASVMDGATKQAGAVAGLRRIKNPSLLALDVLNNSEHVFLMGEGAEAFAQSQGYFLVSNDYFITERREKQHALWLEQHKLGTVGVVVKDMEGHLAAGTSTGGMMGKRWGRVGDVPVIGAGTYADDQGAAISCTGHGEYFIRENIASQLNYRMRFGNENLSDAAHTLLFNVLNSEEGQGGLIGLDKDGNAVMTFNSAGMYRAAKGVEKKSKTGEATRFVGIYGE